MATYYVDYEGGNDASAGTSFATRWKTITNGATAANIAPGDTIRVMASPDPTSIGTATWTGGGRPAAVNIASSTNATPIVITTSAAHGLTAGDYVAIASHTTNTNANGVWKVGTVSSSTTFQLLLIDGTNTTGNGVGGATGTSTKITNCIVKLGTAVTQNIALCGGLAQKPAWTASTNVTCTQGTSTYKEGYSSANIAVGASFTTGKAAYYTLPSSLNLSSYQQVSFWVRLESGTIGAAGDAYIALCTDTLGATVAHTCNIPALGVTGSWVPVVVNLGANLNTAIQSVALYIVTDNGAQTFSIDNIIACKAASTASSLNLTSLISKSSGSGDEAWYALNSINNDVILLSNFTNATSVTASNRGYNETTETVTTYKRETIKTVATDSSTQVSTINDSGTSGSLITFSGGWNRTDMSTQTGQTWYDGQNGNGFGIYCVQNYVSLDRLNMTRYTQGFTIGVAATNSAYCNITSAYSTCNGSGAFSVIGTNFTAGSLWANNNTTGCQIISVGGNITSIKNSSNQSNGASFNGSCNIYVGSLTVGNNLNYGLQLLNSTNITYGSVISTNHTGSAAAGAGISLLNGSNNIFINGGSTSGNISGIYATNGSRLNLNNFTLNETVEVNFPTTIGSGTAAPFVYSNRNDNTDGNHWGWQFAGTFNQQSSVVDSPATKSWKLSPTSTSASANNPVSLKLGTIVCGASSLVTVTARMQRDNTGLTMRLICPGGQIVGVSSDVYTDMTAAANTWETVTITFTPTKAGGVDIYAYAFGGTTYNGYVCNLTASQA